MTRKKAIEIVVANVKMGWMPKRWKECAAGNQYNGKYGGVGVCFFVEWVDGAATTTPIKSQHFDRWYIPRTWLEEKGYL